MFVNPFVLAIEMLNIHDQGLYCEGDVVSLGTTYCQENIHVNCEACNRWPIYFSEEEAMPRDSLARSDSLPQLILLPTALSPLLECIKLIYMLREGVLRWKVKTRDPR